VSRAKHIVVDPAKSGNGSGAHLSTEMIKTMAGVNIVHVPYKAVATGKKHGGYYGNGAKHASDLQHAAFPGAPW